MAVQLFITSDKVNVAGLVLAGSADFKNELADSDMFDQRLKAAVISVVDVSYGGENGFNQAIELSADILANVKFIQEKKLISKFFEEISQDTGKYVFGVRDTLNCLEMGAVETLIVWENLDCDRYTLLNTGTGETVVKELTSEQAKNEANFFDKETGNKLEVQETISLLEWLANDYKKFGCVLEFITNRSQEGSQFCRGFGGIGGILRYQVDLQDFDDLNEVEGGWESDESDFM
jgi:peptide chain release factor subunit 1